MIVDKIEAEFDKQVQSIEKANVMVVGGTGVGKSSLINGVFGEDFAKVGHGEPVTRGCAKYNREGVPVNIYDSEGYEVIDDEVNGDNFENIVLKYVKSLRNKDLSEHIHLFWYCVSVSNHRITEYDIKNIKRLSNVEEFGAKLAVVFTQCDNDELDDDGNGIVATEFRNVLAQNNIACDTFEVMFSKKTEDKLDLDKLIDWSAENLPTDALKASFVGAQKHSLNKKHEIADKTIKVAAASAAGAAGLNPLPASDSLLLMPIQMGMAISIAKTYGFTDVKDSASAILKTQVVSLVGKQLASSFLKLIPGYGQIINAGVASGLTYALGYALKGLYAYAFNYVLENGKEPDWLTLFKELDLTKFLKNN